MMKKVLCSAAAGLLAAAVFSFTALAGSWYQDPARAANAGGVTNWRWRSSSGAEPAGVWVWIDGNGDGLAESYYFNPDGYMLAAPLRPDNYTVDENGAWTKNGVVQAFPNIWVPGGQVEKADSVHEVPANAINPLQNGFSAENATHSDISDEEAYRRLMVIRSKYPDGTPWGENELYISGLRYGYGCAAFIFYVQDFLYGAPARPLTDSSFDMAELRIGDHIRVQNNRHSVIVLTKGDGYITVAEASYYGGVHWGRTMTEEQLRKEFVYRETCY